MNMRKSWIITVLVIICATAAAVSHPKLIHLTEIYFNPFENKMEVREKNVSGIEIETDPNNYSIEVHPKSGEVTIVEEAFPKNASKCVEKAKAEEIALEILLDEEARKILSELTETYGDLVLEFYERGGFYEPDIGEKVCTGEFVIYPKDFLLRNVEISVKVNFVDRKHYSIPMMCDEVLGNFCIRHINPEFREPTDEEREFAEKVLREKGYEWEKISMCVSQLHTILPNGTLIPSSNIYWIILEPEPSKEIYKAVALSFDSSKPEEINEKDVFILSTIPQLRGGVI